MCISRSAFWPRTISFYAGFEGPVVEDLHAFDERPAGVGRAEQDAVRKVKIRGLHVLGGAGCIGSDHVEIRRDPDVAADECDAQHFLHIGPGRVGDDDLQIGEVLGRLVERLRMVDPPRMPRPSGPACRST